MIFWRVISMILMKRALSFSIYLSSDFLRLIIIITTAKPIDDLNKRS